MQEVLSLHMSRTSRSMLGEDRYSPKKLIDASLKDLSNRSRLVEIRVRNDINLSHLKEAMEAFKRYASTEYAEDLKEFSTVDQRKSFIERVLKEAKQLVSDCETLIDTIDNFVKDIDHSSYSMKAVIDCLKLLDGAKGGTVV